MRLAQIPLDQSNPLLVMLFFAVWIVVMGSFLYFRWHVAPRALRRALEESGFQITEQKRAGIFDWLSLVKGSGQWISLVVVRDEKGQARTALARVGYRSGWFCLSVSRCPVELFWRQENETRTTLQRLADATRIRSLMTVLRDRVTMRRLVLMFAIADLVLATCVLAFEIILVVLVAVGIERTLGNLPAPDTYRDNLIATAGALGMFVFYLPALVTLAVGAIGLIRRKSWGYRYHLIGVVSVGVTIFGLLYTLPALLLAIQPEFRDYCVGKDVKPAKPVPIDEF